MEVLAATKYVAAADLPVLAEAGIRLVGENRAQDLQEKFAAHGDLFEWDFIGQLQSRRVRLIVPHVRLIHSVASESALAELRRHAERARPGLRILLEVNVSGEEGKAGIAPEQLGRYLEMAPLPVAGLMTMPPLSADPEESRRWFAALRELADRTASSICRWGPPRTIWSRSRRAQQSCGSARGYMIDRRRPDTEARASY